MKSSIKHIICKGLIGAILFFQMAVAAYACPSLVKSAAKASAVAMTVSTPVDCDQMLDPAAPSACLAYCHSHEQSANHADAPTLPPALLVALYWLAAPTVSEALTQPPETSVLHAAQAPPHAILHCCFRI